MSNFISDCLSGVALITDIESVVEYWHNDKLGNNFSLRETLGMSKDEYVLWMKDPDNINFIVHARQRNIPVEDAIEEFFTLPMAARGSNKEEIEAIVNWLKDEHGIS
jgi:hypothetical protein